MWVLDTSSNSVVATIPTPKLSSGVAITPDGSRVYGTDGDSAFFVVDTKTNTVLAAVAVHEADLGALAITPDGSRAYIAVFNGVLVIDTATNRPVATIPVSNDGAALNGVAITPDGAHVYVTSGNTNTVSVIATATNSIVGSVNSAVTPNGLAISPRPQ
jgi:YVTN family beta-propeller protein